MTHDASPMEQAEAHLSHRRIPQALAAFAGAERNGDPADRCSAGRWMCHMFAGNYAAAWRESDAIRGRGNPDPNRFWTGEPLAGKRILVRCLHGFGDTVQYLRFLPLLNRAAAGVTVQAAPEMQQLLTHFADARKVISWTPQGKTDDHLWDLQIEVAELPYLFRTTPAMLPPPAHIRFPETTHHRIREHLGPRTRPRVGLVWTGSNFDSTRSLNFAHLQPLLSNHSIEFWSLQAPRDNDDWLAYAQHRGWAQRNVHGGDIAGMAALASAMDLVITVDTLAAHVAGSLQLPTWTLLKQYADWRWMLDRDSTPWYPTMRLFRQEQDGDWTPVVERVCQQLRDWREEQTA